LKTCKKCAQDKPIDSFTVDVRYKDGRYPWCFECRKAWREARKDRQKELLTNWRAQNRDYASAQSLAYYHEHRDEELIKRRAKLKDRWHNDPVYRSRKNREKLEHYRNNPEAANKRKTWRAAHSHKRRALIKGTNTRYTGAEFRALCDRYGNRCLCCGATKPLTPDHVVPISCGGSNAIDNIQPLCLECNVRKSAKTIDYRPGWGT
jgi:5-methylcytosine-specific restriction endonuclease McrA